MTLNADPITVDASPANPMVAVPPKVTEILFSLLKNQSEAIEGWFISQYENTKPFLYGSVDIRHSGWKMTPVDTNLFPAGFNLLSEPQREAAIREIKTYLTNTVPAARSVLIIGEDHTRNRYYLDNLHALSVLFESAGYAVTIGMLGLLENQSLETASFGLMDVAALQRVGDVVQAGEGRQPDVIIVNNDFSSGAPEELCGLTQAVLPPPGMGWYRRRKSRHFSSYAEVSGKFAAQFKIDPWLLSARFERCGAVDFKTRDGLEDVAQRVDRVLAAIQQKYDEYAIDETPYVFIKADSGTYGMGIMTVRSGAELLEINKKSRHKMNAIKEGVKNTEVMIQEGVPTIDHVNGNPAEPLVYLIGGNPVGCTYRVNEARDVYGNLNAAGMTFRHGNAHEESGRPSLCPVQGLVGRLALLAATRECYEINWDI